MYTCKHFKKDWQFISFFLCSLSKYFLFVVIIAYHQLLFNHSPQTYS